MAAKKAAAPSKKGRKTKSKADSSSKTSSSSPSSLFFTSSLPGIILAAGVAFWYQYYQSSGVGGGGGKDSNIDINKSVTLGQQQQPPYFTPKAGSWEDGYYSSPIAGQNYPSTHAKLYPNGGIGMPTDVQFQSEEDFLSTGRLYNEFGQIVQNRFHFENGTA